MGFPNKIYKYENLETKRKEIDRRLMPGLVADALVFPYLSFAGAIVGRRGPWYGVENSGGASSFFWTKQLSSMLCLYATC
jgi:hypothetical protein